SDVGPESNPVATASALSTTPSGQSAATLAIAASSLALADFDPASSHASSSAGFCLKAPSACLAWHLMTAPPNLPIAVAIALWHLAASAPAGGQPLSAHRSWAASATTDAITRRF